MWTPSTKDGAASWRKLKCRGKVTKLFGYRRRVVFVHPCGASVMRDRAEIPHVFPEEVVDVDG